MSMAKPVCPSDRMPYCPVLRSTGNSLLPSVSGERVKCNRRSHVAVPDQLSPNPSSINHHTTTCAKPCAYHCLSAQILTAGTSCYGLNSTRRFCSSRASTAASPQCTCQGGVNGHEQCRGSRVSTVGLSRTSTSQMRKRTTITDKRMHGPRTPAKHVHGAAALQLRP
jgi:hypothetical protein